MIKARPKLFSFIGIIFIIIGITSGAYLKTHALTYSDELEAAYRGFFWFGISLAFFIISIASGKILNPKSFCISSILIFAFIFSASFPFLVMPGAEPLRYTYESSDRKFAMYELPGGKGLTDESISLADIKHKFEEFRKAGNESPDVYLCRTFAKDKRIKWYHFYLWLECELGARWQLPYLAPSSKPRLHRFDR